MVPEQGTIGAAGGPLFVLVELSRSDNDAGADAPVLIAFRSDEATIESLPGSRTCPVTAGLKDGGVDADAGVSPHQFAIPYDALSVDSVRKVRESGLELQIPAGSQDVVLVGAAYRYTGSESDCAPSDRQLIASASIRITRAIPDLSVPFDLGTEGDLHSPEDASSTDANTD